MKNKNKRQKRNSMLNLVENFFLCYGGGSGGKFTYRIAQELKNIAKVAQKPLLVIINFVFN